MNFLTAVKLFCSGMTLPLPCFTRHAGSCQYVSGAVRRFRWPFACLLILIGLCLFPCSSRAGYLHASGVTNLDNHNQPIILRGVNLGSWLWPEFYMMGNLNLPNYANAGTGSDGISNYYDAWVAAIQDVLGGDTNLTAQVLDSYWSNFITAADIVYLHQQGFNSVRVPFDFEEFFCVTNWANNYPTNGYDIDVGFKYFDNLLTWCATNNIYVIPDFHCPPGGPNNFAVVNYGGTLNTNTASVFVNDANLALCGHIWTRIAARYLTNQWIGGYDLLNEPVNTSDTNHGPGRVGSPYLANTYSNLVHLIRLTDTNHMLLCEGDAYASTLSNMENPPWTDPSSNLSFSDHDYGSSLPLGTGNRSTCIGLNLPIWSGEFGLNATRWNNRIIASTYEAPFTQSGKTIVEGHCYWAYKACLWDVMVQNPQPPGWKALKAYWSSGNNPSLKPSVTNAYKWLISYAEASNFTNCVVRVELTDSLRRSNTNLSGTGFSQTNLPYKTGVTIPGKIFAVDYDMGDSNLAYVDTVSEDTANRGPNGTTWNSAFFGRDDGVDTSTSTDPGTLLKVGWNDAGEWQRHSITCTPGTYDIYIRYAGGAAGGQLNVMVNSNNVSGTVTLPSTGGYVNYSTYLITNATVTNSGPASVQINCLNPGYDLLWIEFVPSAGAPLPPVGETVIGAQSGIPAGLTAGLQAWAGNSTVSINWLPCEAAASYNVKRSFLPGGPYTTIANCPSLSYLDQGLTNGVTCYYAVSAVNPNGESSNSAEVNATPQPNNLPAPFMDADVGLATLWNGDAGDVGWPGSASYAGGAYTVVGSGVDIWNNVDSFHYLYRGVSGDSTNIVRVVSLQNTDPWAKAGLMVRENLNQDSINAFIAISSQNGALFSFRTNVASASASSPGSGAAPYWVKLVRLGNSFTGFTSVNGSAWNQVGTTNLPMAANYFVGLAITAHSSTRTNAATFDSLSFASQLPLPPANFVVISDSTQITLNWTPVAGATGYNVKRANALGGPYSVIAAGVIGTNYTDLNLTNGVRYYYVVTAINWNGESASSSQTSAVAPLPRLTANCSADNLALVWPQTATTFRLYSATNLTPPVFWSPLTNQITSQSNLLSVTLPLNDQRAFFQLGNP
ncbi:MAG: Endoglucanase [Pedosphaera sp.]|nr:Endoglucanase [Pedosphaera sp.]